MQICVGSNPAHAMTPSVGRRAALSSYWHPQSSLAPPVPDHEAMPPSRGRSAGSCFADARPSSVGRSTALRESRPGLRNAVCFADAQTPYNVRSTPSKEGRPDRKADRFTTGGARPRSDELEINNPVLFQ